ncbi:dimethylhistidine N-methyltransferase [Lewinella aquimaris]|uniref:Dimethylhistidine N-methyltransferase n=1 Tax=Neolewinella aquimaris TaxID=1835722 RepID=A0A840E2A8_9BACT|nr:L-histidine N(alpha)-methyltransferase [Neolewinella aquimaris]MBB4079351.1 dimethylhistidine N-methyltransferase [Neolewinella aquimaris]
MTVSQTSTLSAFAQDVLDGLSQEKRRLSSKWFYDSRGSELFKQIMSCPEYYLTEAEAEIYRHSAASLYEATEGQPFDLIELGAGDGTKTQLLIERFLAAGAQFTYRPIDLSASALSDLGKLIKLRWPRLEFNPIQADYFEALDRLGSSTGSRLRVVLFPGANIGNFSPTEAIGMLRNVRNFLRPGDLLFTGFDLKKDPAVVLAAYNDPAGYTAAFNLNLLSRINRELGGDFKLDCWRHWETYDPVTGAARSFLLPIEPQTIVLSEVQRSFQFRAWEPIQVEISQKYTLREIEGIADASGFDFLRHYCDGRAYFTDSLWQVPTR